MQPWYKVLAMPNGGASKGPLTWGVEQLAPSTQEQYQTTKQSLPAEFTERNRDYRQRDNNML